MILTLGPCTKVWGPDTSNTPAQDMGLRHWKQHFAADADLIFSRRMKLGICGVETVNPGDPVTDEMKAILGRNRLRMWWESKVIELARFDGDLGKQLPRELEPEPVIEPEPIEQEDLDTDHSFGGPTSASPF